MKPGKMSKMKRLCVMLNMSSESKFTKEDLLRRFHNAGVSIKPRTLSRYLIYFRDKEIIHFLEDDKGNTLYQCCDTNKALAYIEGRFQEYAGQVAPRRPPTRPEGTIRHRPNHKIMLSGLELEKAKEIGKWYRHGKPPGYYHIVTDGYNMKVWSSGKAHVFLTGDWRKAMLRTLGPIVIQKVEHEINSGNGHEGIARPLDDRLPDKWLDHLPVKHIASIFSDSGQISTLRYGYSQVAEGELDRHGPVNEPNANQVEKWLSDELYFKTDLRNELTLLNNKLDKLTDGLESMPDLIGRAVGEAVKKAMKEIMSQPEPASYEKKESDGSEDDGMMFG